MSPDQRAAARRRKQIAAICDSSRTWDDLTQDEQVLIGTAADLEGRRRSRRLTQQDNQPTAADLEKSRNLKGGE